MENDKIKLVIGDLLGRADVTSKKVLTAFDTSKDPKVNISAFLKQGISRKDLDACAGFLDITLTADTGEVLYSNREKLAKRIVMEIIALYPSFCPECSKEYSVKPGASPPARCYICLQGSHDCEDFVARHNVMQSIATTYGTVWLCSGCHTANSPSSPGSNPTIATPIQTPWPSMTNSTAGTPKAKEEKLSAKLHAEILADKLAEVKRQQELEEAQPNPNSNVCPLLMEGTCPHGVSGKTANQGKKSCDEFHPPKRCRRFMRYGTTVRFGCTKGTECEFFHPRHCNSSLKDKCCYNEDCKLVHLCGTKRYRESHDSDGQSKSRRRQTGSNTRFNSRNRDRSDQRYSYRRNSTAARERPNPNNASNGRVKSAPNPPRNSTDETPNPLDSHHFLEIRSLLETMTSSFQKEIEAMKIDMAHQKTLAGQRNPNPPNVTYPPILSSQYPASSGLSNQTLLPQQMNFPPLPQSQMIIPPFQQSQTNWAPTHQYSC